LIHSQIKMSLRHSDSDSDAFHAKCRATLIKNA
jgi:hypothetical protein